MIYMLIGLTVGIIMGLTGAGGAMISIPLFMALLDTSLKEATVLSLVAVVFGTAVNLIGQITKVNNKIVIAFSLAGAMANILSLPLKSRTPDFMIAALLTIIGLYSIRSVWSRKRNTLNSREEKNVIVKALFAGAFLGVITTLTGLGGGVILVPILINFFGKSYEEALPTSLGIILLISFTSFISQSKVALSLISLPQLAFIGGGALVAYFILKVFLSKIKESKILQLRRIVFSAVTVYSVISVIIKVM